jgi:hypothetical protein
MTALAQERLTDEAGKPSPSRGTYPIAANTRIFKGSLVCLDAAGRAIPGGLIAAGATVAVGKASSTVDNRTGSALGGAAEAADVEVEFGVFAFESAGAADQIAQTEVGKLVYVVDDQTVAKTSGTSTRIVAGPLTEWRNGQAWVYMGPHVFPLTA